MSKRNLILEIQEKNARASSQYLHGNLELYALQESAQKFGESDTTLRALHIMGIASCIEVSVREAIKRLVDSGAPYIERAELFKEHLRFDFALTRALSEGAITFGDLVSHSLPVSKLEHVSSHFESLFSDKDQRKKFNKIISEIRVFEEPSEEELFGERPVGQTQKTAPLLVSDTNSLLQDIAAIFEVRHLVAHEANFSAVSSSELSKFLTSARLFVDCLYELVEQELNIGRSRNSFGGSIQEAIRAGRIYTNALEIQDRIALKLTSIHSDEDELPTLFAAAVSAFSTHHDAEIDFRLSLHKWVTGNAMRNIEANVMDQLWQHRTNYLKNLEEQVEFYAELDRQ
ncbi:HEPN domain-containing protein [Herbaspirillum sp. B65]|uniref:HEPN domain-containing protein n=1 Tax=Herbaspirillum sp. B65 TaxID=137708 RepID=UPI0005CA3C5A|nr:HEPN domain-containing protein [Herbaspirillum sp. B65]